MNIRLHLDVLATIDESALHQYIYYITETSETSTIFYIIIIFKTSALFKKKKSAKKNYFYFLVKNQTWYPKNFFSFLKNQLWTPFPFSSLFSISLSHLSSLPFQHPLICFSFKPDKTLNLFKNWPPLTLTITICTPRPGPNMCKDILSDSIPKTECCPKIFQFNFSRTPW